MPSNISYMYVSYITFLSWSIDQFICISKEITSSSSKSGNISHCFCKFPCTDHFTRVLTLLYWITDIYFRYSQLVKYVRFFPFSRPEFILFSVNILFKIYPHIFFYGISFSNFYWPFSCFLCRNEEFLNPFLLLRLVGFFSISTYLTLQMADRQAVTSFTGGTP